MSYLYALVDPRDDEIRYIGISIRPSVRFHDHVRESMKDTRTRKRAWIRSLTNDGLEPVFAVIEEGDFTWEYLCALEIAAIAQYTVEGHDLTNQTEGGDGLYGYAAPRTEEWNRKLSEAIIAHNAAMSEDGKKARSEKRIAAIIANNNGVYPGYTKGRTSPMKGRTISGETRAKMKAAHKARWERIRAEGRYEDVCANISAATKLAMNAEKT